MTGPKKLSASAKARVLRHAKDEERALVYRLASCPIDRWSDVKKALDDHRASMRALEQAS